MEAVLSNRAFLAIILDPAGIGPVRPLILLAQRIDHQQNVPPSSEIHIAHGVRVSIAKPPLPTDVLTSMSFLNMYDG